LDYSKFSGIEQLLLDLINLWDFSLFQQLTATFFGALLGIPSGMALYSWTALRSKREKRRQFLVMMKAALAKNYGLLKQMEQDIEGPGKVLYYTLDTSVLEATSSIKYELIDDLSVNQEIDGIRYELLHIQRKLQIHTETAFNLFLSTGGGPERRDRLGKNIGDHVHQVEPRIESLLTKLI
jgi:hypothetical protein